jgi:hypothetical protein
VDGAQDLSGSQKGLASGSCENGAHSRVSRDVEYVLNIGVTSDSCS